MLTSLSVTFREVFMMLETCFTIDTHMNLLTKAIFHYSIL